MLISNCKSVPSEVSLRLYLVDNTPEPMHSVRNEVREEGIGLIGGVMMHSKTVVQ